MRRFWEFISSPNYSRTLGLLAILIIVAAVPLTVLFVQNTKQTQTINQHAAPVSIKIEDNFDRINNSASMGSATGADGTLYEWTSIGGGTWGIASGSAYATSSAINSYSVIDIGTSNADMSVKLPINIQDARIVFGLKDENNLYQVGNNGQQYALIKRVGGTDNTFPTTTIITKPIPSNGDTLQVKINGSDIEIYVNSNLAIQATDNNYLTGTKYGIGTYRDTQMRFDDFSLTSSTTETPTSPPGATATPTQAPKAASKSFYVPWVDTNTKPNTNEFIMFTNVEENDTTVTVINASNDTTIGSPQSVKPNETKFVQIPKTTIGGPIKVTSNNSNIIVTRRTLWDATSFNEMPAIAAEGSTPPSSPTPTGSPTASPHLLFSLFTNNDPKNPTRDLNVCLYNTLTTPNPDPTDYLCDKDKGGIKLSNSSLTFKADSKCPPPPVSNGSCFVSDDLNLTTDANNKIPSGTYQLYVKTPRFLRRRIIGAIPIPVPAGFKLPLSALIPGDIINASNSTELMGDNLLGVADWNSLASCYKPDGGIASTCTNNNADINDDGNVDTTDAQILIDAFAIQHGD